MKVLFAFFHGIGDAVMFSPALKMFKEEHPDTEIGILSSPLLEEIWKNNPNVSKVFTFNLKNPRYGIFPLYLKDRAKIAICAKKIKSEWHQDKYQFIAPNAIHFPFTIPIPGVFASLFPFFYKIEGPEIKQFCKILRVGKNKKWPEDFIPKLCVNKKEFERGTKFIKKIKGKVAIIHSGSTSSRRFFNEEEKKEILFLLLKNNFKVIALDENSPKEKSVICIKPSSISFGAGLISSSSIFIGPDSGPANIAACLKTPSLIVSKVIPPELRFIPRNNLITLSCYDSNKINFAIKKLKNAAK